MGYLSIPPATYLIWRGGSCREGAPLPCFSIWLIEYPQKTAKSQFILDLYKLNVFPVIRVTLFIYITLEDYMQAISELTVIRVTLFIYITLYQFIPR